MKIPSIILALLIALPLLAHPPKGLELAYDADSNILTVEITHSVKDASKHYINKVVVELNGKKIIEQVFKKQVDDELQHVTYEVIDADEGAKITVIGYCNISGKKAAELVVTRAKVKEATE